MLVYGRGAQKSDKYKMRVLLLFSQKVFEEKVNLLVRFLSRRMAFAVGHGNPVRTLEKFIDCNRVIERFPSLRLIF